MNLNYPKSLDIEKDVIGALKNIAQTHHFNAEYKEDAGMHFWSPDIDIIFDITDEDVMYRSFQDAVMPYLARKVGAPPIGGNQTWDLSMILREVTYLSNRLSIYRSQEGK